MSELKPNTEYFKRKMRVILRDLENYTPDELWREVSRTLSGATGLPSAEILTRQESEAKAQAVDEIESLIDALERRMAGFTLDYEVEIARIEHAKLILEQLRDGN